MKKLVAAGLAFLEKPFNTAADPNSLRLGGKCAVGLAFVKAHKPEHPRVKEAVEACRAAMTGNEKVDNYSNGLAIVFLCELGSKKYSREIQWYLDLLRKRQKAHGGWGYDGNSPEGADRETGDTSQTQYAALGYWEAYHHGFRIDPDSLERATDWLLRTQDPGGCWGYQGIVSTGSQRVPQSDLRPSMLAAGLSSALICADLLTIAPADDSENGEGAGGGALPPSVKPAGSEQGTSHPQLLQVRTNRFTADDLHKAIDMAQAWMDKNYVVDVGPFEHYYLYTTEALSKLS